MDDMPPIVTPKPKAARKPVAKPVGTFVFVSLLSYPVVPAICVLWDCEMLVSVFSVNLSLCRFVAMFNPIIFYCHVQPHHHFWQALKKKAPPRPVIEFERPKTRSTRVRTPVSSSPSPSPPPPPRLKKPKPAPKPSPPPGLMLQASLIIWASRQYQQRLSDIDGYAECDYSCLVSSLLYLFWPSSDTNTPDTYPCCGGLRRIFG